MAVAMKTQVWQVVRSTSTPRAAADRDDLTFPRHDGYRSNDFSRLREIVTHFRDGSLAADTSGSGAKQGRSTDRRRPISPAPELRGIWHFGVWLEGDHQLSDESLEAQIRYTRDGGPRAAANNLRHHECSRARSSMG